jgi:hypothetical protein
VGCPVASGYSTNVSSITTDTPRDAAGRRKREATPEQIVDVVARRTMGESLRTIEKATGVPRSTISELLRKPDVAAMVETIRAEVNAAENEQAGAVRREREREQSKRSSKVHRDKQIREAHGEAHGATPGAPKRKVEPKRKKGLGFVRFGWDAAGNFGHSGSGHGDSLSESESFEEFLTRKDEERDLAPYPAPIAILTDDGSTSYDRLIREEIGRAADFLMTYCPGAFPSRNECISALANATTTIDLRSATLVQEAPEPARRAPRARRRRRADAQTAPSPRRTRRPSRVRTDGHTMMPEPPVRPTGLDGPAMRQWLDDLPRDERLALARSEIDAFDKGNREARSAVVERERRAYETRPDVRAVHMLELIYGELETISIALQHLAARDATPH